MGKSPHPWVGVDKEPVSVSDTPEGEWLRRWEGKQPPPHPTGLDTGRSRETPSATSQDAAIC